MNKKKLTLISWAIDIVIAIISIVLAKTTGATSWYLLLIFLLAGPIYSGSKKAKYRNSAARHNYEKETKCNITNVKSKDELLEHRTELDDSYMFGANNHTVKGEDTEVDL